MLELSPAYREVVVLRHFADLSYDEMAAALDIPVKTVKSTAPHGSSSVGRAVVWMGRTVMTPQDEARLDAALNDLAAADTGPPAGLRPAVMRKVLRDTPPIGRTPHGLARDMEDR